jgi:centromere/kinetochore protein ZW10
MLEDITKLPDITADESHRLSELCRMLNALEGLFVEGPEQVRSGISSKPTNHLLT